MKLNVGSALQNKIGSDRTDVRKRTRGEANSSEGETCTDQAVRTSGLRDHTSC